LNLSVPSLGSKKESKSNDSHKILGRVNVGWTLGEELLFDSNKHAKRQEYCIAENECCLLGINKNKLAMLQKDLLSKSNTRDYYVLESVLQGNYLIKQNWKEDLKSGKQDLGSINLERIAGLTLNRFYPSSMQVNDADSKLAGALIPHSIGYKDTQNEHILVRNSATVPLDGPSN
jgi:hypothetical protein